MRNFLFLIAVNSVLTFSVFTQSFQEFNDLVTAEGEVSKLNELRQIEYKKYVDTKNPYYLYNAKYIDFLKAGIAKNPNAQIEALSWVIEDGKQTHPNQLAWFNYHMASNLSSQQAQGIAMEYAKKALELAAKASDPTLKRHGNSLMGSIYFKTEQFAKAKVYYQKAYDLFPGNDYFNRSSMLNNIALCEIELEHPESALTLFRKAQILLERIKIKEKRIETFYVIVSGNIGTAFYRMGQLEEAVFHLEREADYYFNTENSYDLLMAESTLKQLLEIYEKMNNPSALDETIARIKLFEQKRGERKDYPMITEALFKYYSKIGDKEQALIEGTRLYESLNIYSQENARRSTELNEIIYRDKLKHLKKEQAAQKTEVENANREKKYFQIISIVFLFIVLLTVVIIIVVYKNKKKNREKDLYIHEQNIEIESNKYIILENENRMQQEKITNLAMNLKIKKETEKAFLSKILELKRKKTVNTEDVLKDLQISISNLMNVDKRMIFNSIETDHVLEIFKQKLIDLHPSLSKSDVEYCCYFRLNMSAKEIGAIHGQSDGSIRVLKNKIKKKLELPASESLFDYLNKLSE